MINILEDKLRRRMELIDLLSFSEVGVNIEWLSEQLHVSKSTIQRDVDSLNQDFKNYIHIHNELNSLTLVEPNSERLYYLQNLIINSSSNIKLLVELITHPFQKIKDYSEQLNISSSNIYKTIKRFNNSLSPFKIKVTSVNNKYFIETQNEITLRRLFSVFWAELHSFYPESAFKSQKEFFLIKEQLYSDIYTKIKLTQPYHHSFIYLSLLREKQHFNLKKDIKSKNKEDKQYFIDLILESLDYTFFINNPLFNSRKLNTLKEYLNDSFNDKEQADLFFQFITLVYMNEISDQIPLFIFSSKYRQFYNSLTRQSHLYNPIKDMITTISNILMVDLKDYEVLISYVLVVYFFNFLEKNDKKTVYVFSNLSTSHAEFLQKQLEVKFNKFYNFIVVKSKYFVDINKKNYLFVTNDKSINSDNNFIINDYPKQIDLLNLERKLNNFYYSKEATN